MSLMWVSHPGAKPPTSPNLLKSIEKQEVEFDAIDSLGNESACRICGSESKLTKEHSPSKTSFNKGKLVVFSVAPIVTKFLKWKSNIVQGGITHKSLCGNCNNITGSWYNPTYVKFVRNCAPFANADKVYKTVSIKTSLYPDRLLKQALTHILATCQPGLGLRYGQLREMLLNKEKPLNISPIKIGLFIRVNKGGRHSGIQIFVDTINEKVRLIAEFSFWPLGWIMTFDNCPFNGTLDVTSWSLLTGNKKANLDIEIPCQWCISPNPGDFRSPEEVFNDKALPN